MANRRFNDVQALQREVKIVAGLVSSTGDLPLGISDVSIDTDPVVDTLVVTLEDNYNDLYGVSAHLNASSAVAEIRKINFSNNNTITLVPDASFTSAESVWLTLFLKNTSVAK